MDQRRRAGPVGLPHARVLLIGVLPVLGWPAAGLAQQTQEYATGGDPAAVEASPDRTASGGDETPLEPVSAAAADAPSDVALDLIPLPREPAPVPARRREAAPMLEEIIVTARRTQENMQHVPVTVSAMSAEDLAREQIATTQDLQARIPSLVISANGQTRGTESPVIRGQGATSGTGPGVVIYFAEVPLAVDPVNTVQGGPGKFFDLASLQVLKGPQGTLFGRNTTGGALLLQPQKPQDTFSARLGADLSSFSGSGYEAVLNVPVIDDTLMLRAGVKFADRDGFTHDVITGKDYDDRHYWTSRLGVLWRPSASIENYLLGHYSETDDNGTAYVIERMNSEGVNAGIMGALGLSPLPLLPASLQPGCLLVNIAAPSRNCGQDFVTEQQARDVRHVINSADPNTVLKTGGVINTFEWRLGDGLLLRNIASYSIFELHYRWDLDGSRGAFNDANSADPVNQTDIGTYTAELQLQGSAGGEALNYVVGTYYEYTSPNGPQEIHARALFLRDVLQTYELRQRSVSPYLQGTYRLGGLWPVLDGWNLTAGARYNFDWFKARSSPSGDVPVEEDDTALTWTIGLDRRFAPGLIYGKASHGYKTGGFATRAVNPANFTFKPEGVDTYELGIKSDFVLGRAPLRVNAAVYYSDYENMHRAVGDSYVPDSGLPVGLPQFGAAVLNVGRAVIQGFEFDLLAQPVEGFTLSANYAYTHARNKEFRAEVGNLTPVVDCSGEAREIGDVAVLHCIPFMNTPEHQYSVTARYRLPLPTAFGEIEASVTYSWQDDRYSALSALPSEEPGAWLESFGLLNASLSWRNIVGQPLDLQIYGTNLTDELYRVSNSNVWNLLYMQSSMYGEPRIVGGKLTWRFGDH